MDAIPRYGHALLYDEARKRLIVYGGSGSMYLGDMFFISLED
jgi:hypothetical protein